MKLNEMFPSRFFKAIDCKPPLTLTVTGVAPEKFQDGTSKHVVSFRESEKGLVLNKTNAESIAEMYGDDSDRWAGRQIELYSAKVTGPNGLTDGVRVRMPSGKPRAAQQTGDDIGF